MVALGWTGKMGDCPLIFQYKMTLLCKEKQLMVEYFVGVMSQVRTLMFPMVHICFFPLCLPL